MINANNQKLKRGPNEEYREDIDEKAKTEDEIIDAVAAEILERYKPAFEALASDGQDISLTDEKVAREDRIKKLLEKEDNENSNLQVKAAFKTMHTEVAKNGYYE